jgi:hypothetical protein
MISTLTGGGAGPIDGYIAIVNYGGISDNALKIYSRRKYAIAPSLISSPSLYGGTATGARFSDNALYLVVASDQISSIGLRFYQRSGSSFSPISIPGGSLDSVFRTVDITTNGQYFCGNGRIYNNNNGSITFLASVGGEYACTALSPDGAFAAFHIASGSFSIYKRSGSGNSATFASHQTISIDAGRSIYAAKFSRDGVYLAIAFRNINNAHVLQIYKYNTTTGQYYSLNQPPSGGTYATFSDQAYGAISIAYDSSFVALGFTAGSGVTYIYERSNDTFTYRATLESAAVGYNDGRSGGAGSFHPNGNFYITGGGRIYRKVSASNWQIAGSGITINMFSGNFATFSPNIA